MKRTWRVNLFKSTNQRFLLIDSWQEVSTFLLSVHTKAKFQNKTRLKQKQAQRSQEGMREIQCSNVYVLLKNRAILCIQAMLNAPGNRRAHRERQFAVGAPCMRCVGTSSGSGHRHTRRRAGLTADSTIHWSFPETLWSVPMGAQAQKTPMCPSLEGPAWPGVWPLPGSSPPPMGPAATPRTTQQSPGLNEREVLWDPLRKAASCQPQHQSLRMRTRVGRHTLHVCLTSLD